VAVSVEADLKVRLYKVRLYKVRLYEVHAAIACSRPKTTT
jgi:hypothetical protein